MNFSDRLTISVSFINIVATVFLIIVISTVLVIYVIKLNRKVNILTPKFGIGGKNIVMVALVGFLIGVAPLITLLVSNSTEIRRQAADTQDIILNSQILEENETEVIVGFSVVPTEKGILWPVGTYSAVWEVTGPTSFTFLEQDLNSQNPSFFTHVLTHGDYELIVKVTKEDFEVEKTMYLSF